MRTFLAAALTLASAVTLVVRAQDQDEVGVVINTRALTRDRLSVLEVTLRIPDGYVVPAETRGELRGAWLQTGEMWLFSRAQATFPDATAVRLPGWSEAALVYSGVLTVRLPVDVAPGIRGLQPMTVRLGYQLCRTTCTGMRVVTVGADVDVIEPQPLDARLAFRVDASRVIVVAPHSTATDRTLPYTRIAADFVMPVAPIPDGHRALDAMTPEFRAGTRWTLASNGRTFEATATGPAAISSGCEDEMPLALMARVADPAFATERGQHFLATRLSGTSAPSPARPVAAPDLALTPADRRTLEDLLNRRLRMALPSLIAPSPDYWPTRVETPYDVRIRQGAGELHYDIDGFRPAPNEATRLFVHAYWRLDGAARTGLTLWLRRDANGFTVERSDISPTFFASLSELHDDANVASRQEYSGKLLNVVPAEDGWTYFILAHLGYENVSVSVWRYSASGPVSTLASPGATAADMKVLFIGGTGNISGPCVRAGIDAGHAVTILTRGTRPTAVPGLAAAVAGDVTDPACLHGLASQHFDVVVNFIAFDAPDVERDIDAFLGRVGQYIFISSAAVYRRPPPHYVITEDMPLGNAYWEYGRQKIAAENALRSAHATRGFPMTIVRPSFTYGRSWVPTTSGTDYTVVSRMRRGLEIVVPGDGTSLFVLTHASDFARGLVGLFGQNRAIGEAFHITSDEVMTWNDVHETIGRVIGVTPRIVHVPSDFIATVDARRGASLLGDKAWSVVFDNSKIRRVVPDFRAEIPFEQGIRESIAWLEADPSRQSIEANIVVENILERYAFKR